jgi:hypothetical protein
MKPDRKETEVVARLLALWMQGDKGLPPVKWSGHCMTRAENVIAALDAYRADRSPPSGGGSQ